MLLPDTVDYHGSGENPLTRDEAFLNVACPSCGGPGAARDRHDGHVHRLVVVLVPLPVAAQGRRRRSTTDMVERWTPVQQYTGGAEHAVMHLLYSRFWTKAMRDLGLVQESEPFRRLFNQGQILGADGERMSKSRGNVQDPDELVARYGADTVRLFLMFMGPWDQGGPWSPTGIGGVHRFLNRVWTLALDPHGARRRATRRGGALPAGEDEHDARTRDAGRRPPHAARRDRGLRGLPLEHDGRQAHGAGEHCCRATAARRSPALPELGRGGPAAAADARARRAAHHRGAVVAPGRRRAGEAWSSIHTERWPTSTSR